VRDDTPARRRFYGNVKKQRQVRGRHQHAALLPDVPGAPQNTVIGGASLWVMSGKKPAEYKGVAAFFNFLSNPEMQAKPATSAPATCRSPRPPSS
jgi:sn-glycerol 3-phosphate transport system substrate-binding protein